MYAIINKRTRKWQYGTDFRMYPPRQRTSTEKALLFDDEETAKYEKRSRKAGKEYKVVNVRLEVV